MGLKRYDISKEVLPYVNYKWNQLVEIYTQLGDIDNLIKLLEKKDTEESINTLIRLYFAMGDTENTIRKLREKEKRYKLNEDDILIMANVYYAKRDFKQALNILKGHIKKHIQN